MAFPSLPSWQALRAKRYRATRRLGVAGVVQHYTQAGNGRALARWIATKAPVSAHILICRDGHTIQQVDFEHEAVHAGEFRSKGFWKGQPQQDNANYFTIGIENSNYGWLIKDDDGKFWIPKKTVAGYEMWKPYNGPYPVQAADHRGQMRYWEPYPSALVAANVAVLRRIVALYPQITRRDIQGHSAVSPHRKFDPGPAFPGTYILDEVFGPPGGKPDASTVGDIVLGGLGDPPEDVEESEALFAGRDYYDEDRNMCIDPTLDDL